MQFEKNNPNRDDFSVTVSGDAIRVNYRPDMRTYTFLVEDGTITDTTVQPPQVEASDAARDQIRRVASELARLHALSLSAARLNQAPGAPTTYHVAEMIPGQSERILTQAIQTHLGREAWLDVLASDGKVLVEQSADPQIVSFAIEGAGFRVTSIGD